MCWELKLFSYLAPLQPHPQLHTSLLVSSGKEVELRFPLGKEYGLYFSHAHNVLLEVYDIIIYVALSASTGLASLQAFLSRFVQLWRWRPSKMLLVWKKIFFYLFFFNRAKTTTTLKISGYVWTRPQKHLCLPLASETCPFVGLKFT